MIQALCFEADKDLRLTCSKLSEKLSLPYINSCRNTSSSEDEGAGGQ